MCMNSQRINITLPRGLVSDLKLIVPSGKRSSFIAESLEESLKKKKSRKQLKKDLIKSLRANYEYYKKVAKEWEVTELEGWPKQ